MRRAFKREVISGLGPWSFLVALALTFLFPQQAAATSIWYNCPWGDKDQIAHFGMASVVVVATVEKVVVKGAPKDPPVRTVRWKVHESWKGPHYRGADFSTVEEYFGPEYSWDLSEGRAMLLYLKGNAPYELHAQRCGRSGYLEESIEALNDLFRLRQKWEQGPDAFDWPKR